MSFTNIASNAKAVMENSLFTKSFPTLVRGVRALKDKEQAQYIAKALAEIKTEISSTDFEAKTEALRKLIFLEMMGYDMSWASFHIIEIMSQSWFGYRRIAYLAAALCFNQETPVALLATNLLKQAFQRTPASIDKKIIGNNMEIIEALQYDIGAAISCLASIVNPVLAEHLLPDIYNLMNSNRPYIRKKAVLALFRIFLRYPKALKFSFERLKDKLSDEHQGVVSAAVYVLCELAARNPKNYLAMAPQFYNILTSSSNNWVLIKVVKLLGSLVPLEPRLARKLQDPLMEIISSTGAKSLMYECVNTLISGEMTSKAAVRLCLEKLTVFVSDNDQNLKYLGLLGLHKLMKTFPRLVTEHKDIILNCLLDEDETIRVRALDLVSHMVTPRSLPIVVRRIVEHLYVSEGSHRDIVLEHIIRMCCSDTFASVADFEWLIIVLLDLTHIRAASTKNSILLRDALIEVLLIVPDLRPFAVAQLTQLILSGRLCRDPNDNMTEVLAAAAFAVGEYAQYTHSHIQVIRALLSPSVSALSPNVQAACVQAAIKVFTVGLAQPYFSNLSAAQDWKSKQDEEAEREVTRVAELKKSATIRKQKRAAKNEKNANKDSDEEDSDDDDSESESEYEEDSDEDESEEDSEDEDEDEEGDHKQKRSKKRRAKRETIVSAGHAVHVGRTLEQHVLFVEEMICLLLARLAHFGRSIHAEVQERAQINRTLLSILAQDTTGLRIPAALLHGVTLTQSQTDAIKLTQATLEDKSIATADKTVNADDNVTDPDVDILSTTAKKEGSKSTKTKEKNLDVFELFSIDMFDPLNALNISKSANDSTSTSKTIDLGLNSGYDFSGSNQVDSILQLLNATPSISKPTSPRDEKEKNDEESAEGTTESTTTETSSLDAKDKTIDDSDSSDNSKFKEQEASIKKLQTQLSFFWADSIAPPTSLKVQRKVPIPDGLDLDEPICDEPDSDDERDKEEERLRKIKEKQRDEAYETRLNRSMGLGGSMNATTSLTSGNIGSGSGSGMSSPSSPNKFQHALGGGFQEENGAEAQRRREAEERNKKNNPFYIGASASSGQYATQAQTKSRTDDILATLDLSDVATKSAKKKGKKDGNDEGLDGRKMTIVKQSKNEDEDDDEELEGAAAMSVAKKAKGKKTKKNDDDDDVDILAQPKTYAEIEEAKRIKALRVEEKKKDEAIAVASSSPSAQVQANPAYFVPTSGHSIVYHDEAVTIFLYATPIINPKVSSAQVYLTVCGTPTQQQLVIPAFKFSIAPQNSKKTICESNPEFVSQGTVPSQLITDEDAGPGCVVFQVKKLQNTSAYYATGCFNVHLKAITPKNLQFNGSVSYKMRAAEKGKGDAKTIEKEITFSIPTATFIAAEKKSSADVMNLLSDPDTAVSCLASAQITCSRPLAAVIRDISSILRVQLVEAANFTTLYYGTYMGAPAGSEHVCVYAKALKGASADTQAPIINVDIKTCSQPLSDILLKELESKL